MLMHFKARVISTASWLNFICEQTAICCNIWFRLLLLWTYNVYKEIIELIWYTSKRQNVSLNKTAANQILVFFGNNHSIYLKLILIYFADLYRPLQNKLYRKKVKNVVTS